MISGLAENELKEKEISFDLYIVPFQEFLRKRVNHLPPYLKYSPMFL